MNVLDQAQGEGWALYHGDSCEVLGGMPTQSVDLTVFSPPFQSLFVYSPSSRDLGNCRSRDQFWQQFAWVSGNLLRVMRPGRNVCVHVANIGTTKTTHGVTGVYDFRGDTIRHFVDSGFVYHGEAFIRKNPQAQAIRTHAQALLFVQLEKNSLLSRPALADYFLIFRTPGENATPVHPEVSREEWIDWAGGDWPGYDDPQILHWPDISESDTLNAAAGRDEADNRHICPLQLTPIERCIRLYTNRGETVLSPFAGIGSELYQAVLLGRRGLGIELKKSYYDTAVKNLREAERRARTPDLFTWQEETADASA